MFVILLFQAFVAQGQAFIFHYGHYDPGWKVHVGHDDCARSASVVSLLGNGRGVPSAGWRMTADSGE